MTRQSTRHFVMIEPAAFAFNPETASTNDYQVNARETGDQVHATAIKEFRAYRDALIDNGVFVTTLRGDKRCPDAVFPNWFSTHQDGSMTLYPMMAKNRRLERLPEIVELLKKFYALKLDLSPWEEQGRAIESTSSLVLDRVNKVAYLGRSKRSDEMLAREWCGRMGYELVAFDTVDHTGKPVYHTNVLMWIGSGVAGVCSQVIAEADRERVLGILSRDHEIIEFDNAQIRAFSGNSLEVRGHNDEPMLVMPLTSYKTLTSDQLSRLKKYYTKIITPDLPTIETYGGGSARCMLQELY